MKPTPVLAVERAAFAYAGQHRAIGPFDLQARAGELHLVSGPSGCGKSTLARLLSGVIPHLYRGRLTGRAQVEGIDTVRRPLWQLSAGVGLVAQNPAAQLLATTVRDEVRFGLETLGLHGREVDTRADAALDRFGLHTLAERDPRTLSGGEQQKLVLAAITARQPQSIVLDEPLSMLDAAAARDLVLQIDGLRARGTTIIVCEHRQAAFAHLADVHHHRLPSTTPADHPLPAPSHHIPPCRITIDALRVMLGGREVLRGVEATLTGGEVVGLVGPNGSGKTTLLRTLVGLQPHRGHLGGTTDGDRPTLGLTFQNPDCQIFNPTVRDEILYGCEQPDLQRYRHVIELLGLTPYEDTPPLLLSEGEKKRMAVALLLMRPGLRGICFDEPTLGQDERHRALLGRILRHLAATGYLCVAATHDSEWARRWCDRILSLHGGRIATDVPAVPTATRAIGCPTSSGYTPLCHSDAARP